LLVELLTGRSARVTTEAAADAPKGPRIGAVQLPCRLPREETRLLTELLQEDPSRRPDARVLLQRLQSIRQRRGRRVRYVVAALLSTLAIVGAARYTLDLRHERNLALAARANADTARLQAEDLALFMLEDLYKGLLEVGRLDLLEPVAKQAVEHFAPARDAEGDAHRALRPESGLALMRAAEVLDFQGRLPESIDVAQRAIGLLERLENEPGSDAEGLHSRYLLAQALAAQSMTLSSAARYSEAIVQAQRALDISLGLMDLIDRPPTPAPSQTSSAVAAEELWHNLLNAHSALGDSQLRAGLPEQAIATLDAAVALVDDAIVARPSLATIRADLLWTRCLAYLDDARSNDLIDACQRPLRMDRQASRDAPDDVQTAYNLANSLWLMGEALRRSGRPLEALDYSQEGAQIARELIRRDPDQPHNHNLLAINLLSRARALEQLGQTEAMQQTLQEVLEITRSIVVGSEDHLIMHTHTTALTLLGRTAEARAWAQKLLDAGWRRPEFLELCQRHALLDDCTATQ
jgi:tetratricopeptide (TPR) repeat protein